MRNIKFRGLDANGVMRHGRLSQDKPNETVYYKEYSQRICWDDSNIPVRNKTLSQFTGLKDKKGKEIYFDDLCSYVDGVYQIAWNGSILCLQAILVNGYGVTNVIGEYLKNMIVIGNIYENPELLNGEGRV